MVRLRIFRNTVLYESFLFYLSGEWYLFSSNVSVQPISVPNIPTISEDGRKNKHFLVSIENILTPFRVLTFGKEHHDLYHDQKWKSKTILLRNASIKPVCNINIP